GWGGRGARRRCRVRLRGPGCACRGRAGGERRGRERGGRLCDGPGCRDRPCGGQRRSAARGGDRRAAAAGAPRGRRRAATRRRRCPAATGRDRGDGMIGVAPPAYDPAAPTTAGTLPVGSPTTVRAYVGELLR